MTPKPQYILLYEVLKEAFHQAQDGKGKERHAEDGQNFEEQLIMQIERFGVGFQLGQAIKKIVESKRLPTDRAILELYGAIIYIAAKIIDLKREEIKIEEFLSRGAD